MKWLSYNFGLCALALCILCSCIELGAAIRAYTAANILHLARIEMRVDRATEYVDSMDAIVKSLPAKVLQRPVR